MNRAERIAAICADHVALEGPLLPILHAVQATFGCVDAEAERIIALTLNLSRAEVHGVVSFYHDFRAEADPRPEVQLCRAEACQAVGGDRVAAHARAVLGVDWHGTSADGVTLEPVFCLGLCACGPAVMVDGRLVGRVDEARLDGLLAGVRA